ncbi:hypothetical protein SRHO_G00157480 [Serrasalmus rhombeus]
MGLPYQHRKTASFHRSHDAVIEASRRSLIVKTNSIFINELELTVATGGTGGSCYRCTLPFGVVLLMIGVAVTAVAYSFNSHGSTISILGLVLLSSSVLLLGLTAVCWKVRRGKEMEMRSRSQTTLVASETAGTGMEEAFFCHLKHTNALECKLG